MSDEQNEQKLPQAQSQMTETVDLDALFAEALAHLMQIRAEVLAELAPQTSEAVH
jgi:hypothetical protein